MLLVEGIRVNKGAMAGLRLRSVVEDPDNLVMSVGRLWVEHGATSYRDHGEQNVTSGGCLKGSDGRVNERVD